MGQALFALRFRYNGRVDAIDGWPQAFPELHVGGQVIETTGEHPFYVKDHGWLPAAELNPGDLLSTSAGGWIAVERVEFTHRWTTVYNMRVADFHTYFVGDATWGFDVWAHNRYTGSYSALGNNVELRTYEIKSSRTGGSYFRKLAFNTKTREADFSQFYLRDRSGNPVIETIQYTGSRKADFALANTQQGRIQPNGYTWHHLDYDSRTGMGRMVLVKTDVHRAVGHSGGTSTYVSAHGLGYGY